MPCERNEKSRKRLAFFLIKTARSRAFWAGEALLLDGTPNLLGANHYSTRWQHESSSSSPRWTRPHSDGRDLLAPRDTSAWLLIDAFWMLCACASAVWLQEPLCSHSHKSRKPVYLVLGSRSSMGRSAFASFLHTCLNPIGSRFRNQAGAGVKHSYIDDCLIQYDSDHDCSVLRQDQPSQVSSPIAYRRRKVKCDKLHPCPSYCG